MKAKVKGKRNKQILEIVNVDNKHSIESAVSYLKSCPPVKFIETLELAVNLGTDPTKPEQQVRGTLSLPKGLGKNVVVAVMAEGANADKAKAAGADIVGNDDLEKKILEGWAKFDVLITTPDMMRKFGALGRKLGPKGLMPSPKAGTVTMNVEQAVKDFKLGKLEIKSNRHASIHAGVGKMNMSNEDLVENVKSVVASIVKMKPSSASGKYIKSIFLTTTMGPGLKIDEEQYVN